MRWHILGTALAGALICSGCARSAGNGPCHSVDCSGNGQCALLDGEAICVCDAGFIANGPTACVPGMPGGACTTNADCNDGNPCTDDTCGADLTCTTVFNTSPCDDGQFCTEGDACAGGTCTAGSARDCSSATDACNDGVCDETADACVGVPVMNGTMCDDADTCTEMDECTGGVCAGTLLDSDDDGAPDGACGGTDCADNDPNVSPLLVEGPFFDPICADMTDNDCDMLTDGADPSCVDHSTVTASATTAPANGSVPVTITVVPRDPLMARLGPGLTVEVRADAFADVAGAGPCATPATTCAAANDDGMGAYTVVATSSVVGTVEFSAIVQGMPPTPVLQTTSVTFDTSGFIVINTDTTVTAAVHGGQSLLITGGTVTFDPDTVGVAFGDVFVTGGSLTHPATTTSVVHSLDIVVDSFNMSGGAIDVDGLGYTSGRSYGASSALASTGNSGASHGGYGGHTGNPGQPGPTYDNYRDPVLPGAGVIFSGGGVVRIESGGACAIDWPAVISANGGQTGAGGSVRLRCASFSGTAIGPMIEARGGDYRGGNLRAAGGGGRIALISTGDRSSFSGALTYPTGAATADALLGALDAGGGNGNTTYGHGGAGTVFVSAADVPDGDLLLGNGATVTRENGGTTFLVSLGGTLLVPHAAGTPSMAVMVSTSPALTTAFNDLYVGVSVRPDLTFDNGTPDDWSDDNVVTVATHDDTVLTMTANFGAVAAGTGFRSIDVLEHIYLGAGTTLETNGDIYLRRGELSNPGSPTLVLESAMISLLDGAALTYPGLTGGIDLTHTTGLLSTTASSLAGNLSVSGGSVVFLGDASLAGASVSGDGSLIVRGDLDAPDFNVSDSGSARVDGLMSVPGDITIDSDSTSALTAGRIDAGNFMLVNGTVLHRATTTSVVEALEMDLTGELRLTDGTIDLGGLGYTSGRSFGAGGPATALASIGNAGASHGGHGGDTGNSSQRGPTYGDYRDPLYPGAGTIFRGGGVLHVTAGGACVVDWPATISVNGQGASAGGSINLRCGSFAGTAFGASLTANGGNALTGNLRGAGGGGRIALVSSGPRSSFSGAFTYPTDATSLGGLLGVLSAHGGEGSGNYGNGGAGTIYLQAADAPDGDLIIDNGAVVARENGGATQLRSVAGTLFAPHSGGSDILPVSVTSTPAFTAAVTDLYVGVQVRPDLGFTNGTAADWTDDNVVTVATNDDVVLQMTTNFPAVAAGASFRSIDILEHIHLGPGVTLETHGDVYPRNGYLVDPGTPTLTLDSAIIDHRSGSAINYPGFGGDTDVVVASGALHTRTAAVTGEVRQTGAALTFKSDTILNVLDISGTGTFVNRGSLDVPNLSVTGDAGAEVNGILRVPGTITIDTTSANALIAGRIEAGTFALADGTVKHLPTTTSTVHRLDIDLTGAFTLTGGSIDVSGLGYTSGRSFGATGPSTALASIGNGGGSHGGTGGYSGTPTHPGPAYGDFRAPWFPGAGSIFAGGGVIRVIAGGACTLDWPMTLIADGADTGAGGSISLRCPTIGGTATGPSISAIGGDLRSGNLRAAAGGGRIALVSTGPRSSFTGTLAYPTDAGSVALLTGIIFANGGEGNAGFGNGGAGTIYFEAADAQNGDLIVDNSSVTLRANGGATQLVATTANGSVLTGSPNANTGMVAAGTPLAGWEEGFRDHTIHVWPSAGSDDPLDMGHTSILLDGGNDSNSFYTTGGSFPPISNDHDYRFVYTLEHLEIRAGTLMDTNGADLILIGCDLHSVTSTDFEVPATSMLTGNSLASSSCTSAGLSTVPATIDFANYFLP